MARMRFRDRREHLERRVIEIVSIRRRIKERNDRSRFREVFEEFQAFPLTKAQTDGAVSHARETLIVAGAGSGKTSLLLGRAKYLLESGRAQPEQVLALAYNRRAAKELEDRAKALNLPIDSKTFHSYGNQLLNAKERIGEVAFAEVGAFTQFLEAKLEELRSSPEAHQLASFIALLMVPFRPYEDYGDVSDYAAAVRSVPRTLKGEFVKSHGEWVISNYLFTNGYDARYEQVYDVPGFAKNRHKPDFTVVLPDGRGIYVEYFGIDGEGRTAPGINAPVYNASIEWKRKVHAECGTPLVELTYQDLKDGVLVEKLSQVLSRFGAPPDPLTAQAIIEKAESLGYLTRFGRLCGTFIQHSRAQRLTAGRLRIMRVPDARTASFLGIVSIILGWYENELKRVGAPDYADMIHRGADLLEAGQAEFPYSHVLVDEYQDISADRQRLLDAMRVANPELEITMVGDDWQSINRFAGSDLSIMRAASSPRFNRKVVPLGETHRFSQSLANASSMFVQKNPAQLAKDIMASRPETGPSLYLHWDVDARDVMANVQRVIERIGGANAPDAELLVIARYRSNLPEAKRIEALWRGPVEVRTIHSSKGMEADYVIVTDVQQDWRGFPSTIQDDPVLRLVLPSDEGFEYAEERRIFYVAMTRARVACHLVTPAEEPSLFASELLADRVGEHIGGPVATSSRCPACGSGSLVRSGRGGLYCSNRPICRVTTPKCPTCDRFTQLVSTEPIVYRCPDHLEVTFTSCPVCRWGVLVTRTSKYGEFESCHTWQETRCPGKATRSHGRQTIG